MSKTFIIDCPWCKAKVAATETGRAESSGFNYEADEPFGYKVLVGICPSCESILAGETQQIDFINYHDSYEDRWSDLVRIYPKPSKSFSSYRIPRVVKDSLNEADRCIQAGASIAACAMLGRALEALCRDILEPALKPAGSTTTETPSAKPKEIMLGEGIKRLHEGKVIDDRLFDWSQQLHAFRNLAAHAEDTSISKDDAEDLQIFVNTIVEYIYDLADRYEEFKARVDRRAKRKKS